MDKNEVIGKYYEEEYANLVRRITFRAGSPENAEDIVQEAFTLAIKYFNSYDPEADFGGWFDAILNNATRKFKRDERLYGMCEEFEEEEHEGLEMDVLHHDVQKKIREDMKLGNALHSSVIDLYFNKMYVVRDIVKVTDLKPKHVKLIVQRFKDTCKAKYAIGG